MTRFLTPCVLVLCIALSLQPILSEVKECEGGDCKIAEVAGVSTFWSGVWDSVVDIAHKLVAETADPNGDSSNATSTQELSGSGLADLLVPKDIFTTEVLWDGRTIPLKLALMEPVAEGSIKTQKGYVKVFNLYNLFMWELPKNRIAFDDFTRVNATVQESSAQPINVVTSDLVGETVLLDRLQHAYRLEREASQLIFYTPSHKLIFQKQADDGEFASLRNLKTAFDEYEWYLDTEETTGVSNADSSSPITLSVQQVKVPHIFSGQVHAIGGEFKWEELPATDEQKLTERTTGRRIRDIDVGPVIQGLDNESSGISGEGAAALQRLAQAKTVEISSDSKLRFTGDAWQTVFQLI